MISNYNQVVAELRGVNSFMWLFVFEERNAFSFRINSLNLYLATYVPAAPHVHCLIPNPYLNYAVSSLTGR